MTIYLLFLVFISGPVADDSLHTGVQIPDDEEIFSSKKECVDKGILIAQVFFVKTGDKYSVKCVKAEYKPPVSQ
jgi:hypothetical protein